MGKIMVSKQYVNSSYKQLNLKKILTNIKFYKIEIVDY